MKEVKLKDGKKVKLKKLSLDEVLSIEDIMAVEGAKKPSTSMVKMFRIAIDGDISDSAIKRLLPYRDKIIKGILEVMRLGEEKPST